MAIIDRKACESDETDPDQKGTTSFDEYGRRPCEPWHQQINLFFIADGPKVLEWKVGVVLPVQMDLEVFDETKKVVHPFCDPAGLKVDNPKKVKEIKRPNPQNTADIKAGYAYAVRGSMLFEQQEKEKKSR